MVRQNSNPSSKLVLTALLSSGLTILISISYMVLCTIALIYNRDCDVETEAQGANYFWDQVYFTYIQDCNSNAGGLEVTTAHTVFILLIITLITSALCLIMAGILTAVVRSRQSLKYINMTVYSYIGLCIASLVVDLTFATHFGLDYMSLRSNLGPITSDYRNYAIYYGAFMLMTIALKGYIAHAINIVLIVLLAVYVFQNRNWRKDEHSIHKIGVLNAFESHRSNDDNWSQHPNYPPFTRGSHNGFIDDEDLTRGSARYLPRPGQTSNRSFDRSDSWHHSRVMPDPVQGSRPFSYLEEIKRPVAVKPPASPMVEGNWRREQWGAPAGPALPAPDYSPQTPRRLKSALKSGYM